MVDYNIAIPQQQLFQAPDLTQNAMRMQQMQMQEMQTQELARKRREEAALRGITADPNSPEYARQAMLVSPEFGLKAIAMQRQNTAADRAADASTRQAQEATVRMANIRQTMGDAAYTSAQNRLAAIPAGDAGSYAKWYGQFKPAFIGTNLPTPEQWAQDTNGQLKSIMLATAESARALAKPEVLDVGGVKTRYVPGTGTAEEIGITPFAPRGANTGAGAGTGPAMVPMPPSRAAEQRATQARLGETVAPFSTAGANVSVNNMPGVPIAPPVGAPVNNMPGVPAPEAGAKNAMRAGPVSAGDFARAQKAEEDKRILQQEATKERQRLEIVQQEKIQANLPQIEDAAEQTLKNIEGLIGGAQVDDKGRIVYAKGANRAHPGFGDAVGLSFSKITGGPIPGSPRSNFEKRLDQVKGSTFLDAYNMLRGGGAIDQKEGQKATAALNRMDLAQSEVEFVRAARDFEEIVKKGVARARTMAQGGAGSNMTSAATAAATAPQAKPAERQVKRSGMYNGRRVVEYSDGATEYAD
jgi:hypothetical protein